MSTPKAKHTCKAPAWTDAEGLVNVKPVTDQSCGSSTPYGPTICNDDIHWALLGNSMAHAKDEQQNKVLYSPFYWNQQLTLPSI